MTCKLCQLRPVPENYGSPRRCAFGEFGEFIADNWNCETMNELRGAYIWKHRDDQVKGSICVLPVGEISGTSMGYLVLTYYKDRGETGGARIVQDDQPDVPLSRFIAEHMLGELGIAP